MRGLEGVRRHEGHPRSVARDDAADSRSPGGPRPRRGCSSARSCLELLTDTRSAESRFRRVHIGSRSSQPMAGFHHRQVLGSPRSPLRQVRCPRVAAQRPPPSIGACGSIVPRPRTISIVPLSTSASGFLVLLVIVVARAASRRPDYAFPFEFDSGLRASLPTSAVSPARRREPSRRTAFPTVISPCNGGRLEEDRRCGVADRRRLRCRRVASRHCAPLSRSPAGVGGRA